MADTDQKFNGLRVLAVDDEEGIRNLLIFELSSLGCQTHKAADATEALKILEAASFDLIITDIRMPGMDGIDFIDAYRGKNPTQKAVFITGYAIEEKLAKALLSPLSLCLKKPFTLNELHAAISALTQKG